MRGTLDPRILWLTAAVTCWTAGFDIIYSCQDYEFDCAKNCSAFRELLAFAERCLAARLLHVVMVLCLVMLVVAVPSWRAELAAASPLVVALLLYEHSLVSPDDLSRVNAAFFHHEWLRQRVVFRLLGGRHFAEQKNRIENLKPQCRPSH